MEGCLRSLPDACAGVWASTEVIVVDNASTDNSVEMVRREFPVAKLIVLPENRGFTAGNNMGIAQAQGEYVFVLNPDTVCHVGSIAILCEYMEAHPEVGIAGPLLLNGDGTLQPSRRRFPTVATALVESTPLQARFRRSETLRQFYVEDKPEEEQYVDWVSGAALMCRHETLEQIGPFDTGFFMFSEEVDLCKRAADAGWRTAYVPQAEITHFGGGSTDQAVAGRHIYFNTSKARYFEVHEGRAVGALVRWYLLATYVGQAIVEGAKWALGHKRAMRGERLRMYGQVLKSGLRNGQRKAGKASVLLITGEYPPARGGVGDYTSRLAGALREQGVQATVYTQQPTGAEDEAMKMRSTQHVIRSKRITFTGALSALKRSRAQIAHIQYQTGAYQMRPIANMLPVLLRRRWGRPVVVTFHDLLVPYLFPKAGPVREWANRAMAKAAAAVIATNEEDAARLEAWGVKRVELIPIGSNIKNAPPEGFEREAWRRTHGVDRDSVLLTYFGFLNSTKGLDILLRGMARLQSEHPDRYRLMMVGGGLGSSDPTNRATAEALDKQARELGIADKILWTGYLEAAEVSAALLSADVAVLPFGDGATFRRGSLLAVLEHGLPLITTRGAQVDGVRQRGPRLVDGENALLVAIGDEEGLVGAIEKLAEDEEMRRRLGRGAAELARHFSWEGIAEKHVELYSDLSHDVLG